MSATSVVLLPALPFGAADAVQGPTLDIIPLHIAVVDIVTGSVLGYVSLMRTVTEATEEDITTWGFQLDDALMADPREFDTCEDALTAMLTALGSVWD